MHTPSFCWCSVLAAPRAAANRLLLLAAFDIFCVRGRFAAINKPFQSSCAFADRMLVQGAGSSQQGVVSSSQSSAVAGCSKLQALLNKLREVEAGNIQVRTQRTNQIYLIMNVTVTVTVTWFRTCLNTL